MRQLGCWDHLLPTKFKLRSSLFSSFPRKNVTPADSKPGRESSLDSGSRCAWPE